MTAPRIVGTRATLRPPVPGDVAQRRSHGWHSEIERNYGHSRESGPMNDADMVEWQSWIADNTSDTFWHVEVDATVAGVAFLHRIRDADAAATYAIGFYSPDFAGHGLGTDVTRLVLRHAFDDLGLHRVDLRVLEFNTAAIRCYQRCGFVVEGRERDSCRIGDLRYADIIMGVLADEFRIADSQLGPT